MKEVSAAIIIEDGKILLTKRNSNGDLSGYWEFPGGKRENNETMFECLEREIKEELNVHDEYIWTEISNLPNYKLAPADTHIAKLLLEEYDT